MCIGLEEEKTLELAKKKKTARDFKFFFFLKRGSAEEHLNLLVGHKHEQRNKKLKKCTLEERERKREEEEKKKLERSSKRPNQSNKAEHAVGHNLPHGLKKREIFMHSQKIFQCSDALFFTLCSRAAALFPCNTLPAQVRTRHNGRRVFFSSFSPFLFFVFLLPVPLFSFFFFYTALLLFPFATTTTPVSLLPHRDNTIVSPTL